MDDFDYAAHVTFIQVKGEWTPWDISFTSVIPPFKTTTISLLADKLCFWYEDFKYNYNVHNFPRMNAVDPVYLAEKSEMKEAVMNLFRTELILGSGWNIIIGAVDYATYSYLKDFMKEQVILLQSKSRSADLALAAAFRYAEQNKNWVNDDMHKDDLNDF